MTRQQAQTSKLRTALFTENVRGDPEAADPIRDEDLEEWAERKRVTLTNPARRRQNSPELHEPEETMAGQGKSKADLEAYIKQLEDENDDLQDQLDQIVDIAAPDEGDDSDDNDGDNGTDHPLPVAVGRRSRS